MMKFAVSVLLVAILVSLLGSCASVSGSANNFVTYEGNLMNADVRYERLVFANESVGNVSVGANAFAGKYGFGGGLHTNDLSIISVNVFARYYLFGKTFFAGLGLGYSEQFGHYVDDYVSLDGVTVVPELGFKIDIGEEGKFYIQPGLKVPVISGELRSYTKTGWVDYDKNNPHKNWLGYAIYPYFGIGYAF